MTIYERVRLFVGRSCKFFVPYRGNNRPGNWMQIKLKRIINIMLVHTKQVRQVLFSIRKKALGTRHWEGTGNESTSNRRRQPIMLLLLPAKLRTFRSKIWLDLQLGKSFEDSFPHYGLVIGFFDHVDLWVIKMKSPWSFGHVVCRFASEQSAKHRSLSEDMWKVCLFYSQNNKIVWFSNMADTFWRNLRVAQRFVGFLFLDCAFGMLIGGADKLRSRGSNSLGTLGHIQFLYCTSSLCSYVQKACKQDKRNILFYEHTTLIKIKNKVLYLHAEYLSLCLSCTIMQPLKHSCKRRTFR